MSLCMCIRSIQQLFYIRPIYQGPKDGQASKHFPSPSAWIGPATAPAIPFLALLVSAVRFGHSLLFHSKDSAAISNYLAVSTTSRVSYLS